MLHIKSCFLVVESGSLDAESDAEFRCRVEKMRQLGGDSWLRMYEVIQCEDRPAHQVSGTTFDSSLDWQLSHQREE